MAQHYAAIVAVFLLISFVVMVVWGALGLTFGFTTIGYGTACLVVVAVRVAVFVLHGGLVGLGR